MLSQEKMTRLFGTSRQRVYEVLSFAGLVASIVILLVNWSRLPDVVPIHFNLRGEPDGWAGRASMIVLPSVALFVYLVCAVATFLPERFINVPRGVPVQIGYELCQCMKMEAVWLFVVLEWATIQVALDNQKSLGAAFLFVALFIIFLTLVVYLIHMLRVRRIIRQGGI